MNKIKFGLFTFLVISIPFFINAHVKWFTDSEGVKPSLEKILSPTFLLLSIIVAITIAFIPQITSVLEKMPINKKSDSFLEKIRPYNLLILQYGTALSLLLQLSQGNIFALEIPIQSNAERSAFIVLIVSLFIPQRHILKLSSMLGTFLFFASVLKIGIFHMLDYGFYLALFISFLLHNTKFQKLIFPGLYLATGLSLCWVALEKWIYPNMTMDIIKNHNVPTFGFSPDTFIILAAFIEFVVGYLLIVGILNRLLSVLLTFIFILTTTLFGWTEIFGHLIIHTILITFIIEGTSFYKPPITKHENKIDQMLFVFLNFIFALSFFILLYYRFG